MLDWLKQRALVNRKAVDLYGKVVAAARNPWFYGSGRVADTPEGRFELLILHLYLIAERVKELKPDGTAVVQAALEAFVTDMDDCMREMGVGDLTVPKRVRRAAAVFYERAGSYRTALADGESHGHDDPLAAMVARTILNSELHGAFASALAAYIRACRCVVADVGAPDIASGQWAFAPVPVKAEVDP
jgi:cytochrome b pre-mRNA-processing protein 3